MVLENPETTLPTNSIAGLGKKYIMTAAAAAKSSPMTINGFCFPSASDLIPTGKRSTSCVKECIPNMIPVIVADTPSEIRYGVRNGIYRYKENKKIQVKISRSVFFKRPASYEV